VSVSDNCRLKSFGPATVTAAAVPSGSPVMVTARLPVVAVQVTLKVTLTVCAAATVTSMDSSGTVQLAVRSPSSTVWAPGVSSPMVTVASGPILCGAPPSMLTVYPFPSGAEPLVTAVTDRLPVAAVQVMV
jgi:hypothetical protein